MVNSNLAHKLDNENTIDVETNDIPLKWCSVSLLSLFAQIKKTFRTK